MVWYGMVWYGMVWYGMVWYGMLWYVTRASDSGPLQKKALKKGRTPLIVALVSNPSIGEAYCMEFLKSRACGKRGAPLLACVLNSSSPPPLYRAVNHATHCVS